MLTFSVLLILGLSVFVNGATIRDLSDNVAIDMIVPRGQTRDEYLKSIVDYWTPERRASAIPLDTIVRDEKDFVDSNNEPRAERAATVLTPSALLPGMISTKPKIAGKVYFTVSGQNYICSGSVVNSESRDVVLTAGHCVFDYERQVWASLWVFVPEYAIGSRPLGTFAFRKLATKSQWMNSRDFNNDVGLVLVNPNEKGQHVQDVAGGLGITLDSQKNLRTTSFGYPKNMNSGETVSNCVGTPLSPTFLAGFTGVQLSCAMTGGSSGGPWIQQYDANSQTGQQVSVNSFIVSNRPNNMFGPHFTESNIGSLYRAHQDQ
ncbi:unnamed protein product [Rotaria magnacalcarata]|uniref:Peptidase S1 domain-containing protein n=2 Tax=Rotaria magnacalcarata TaxID=392030 RepID=A0A816S2C3_9BILA|nr:unnamed protein product [Rotaria magnacalcarata]